MSRKKQKAKLFRWYEEFKYSHYCVLCGSFHDIHFHRVEDGISIHDLMRKTFSINTVKQTISERTVPLCRDCLVLMKKQEE
jgi:hypothetical protein